MYNPLWLSTLRLLPFVLMINFLAWSDSTAGGILVSCMLSVLLFKIFLRGFIFLFVVSMHMPFTSIRHIRTFIFRQSIFVKQNFVLLVWFLFAIFSVKFTSNQVKIEKFVRIHRLYVVWAPHKWNCCLQIGSKKCFLY